MHIDTKLQEIHFKIIYCGLELSGVKTNLTKIHRKIFPQKMNLLTFNQYCNDKTLTLHFTQFAMSEFNGFTPVFDLYAIPCDENLDELKDIIFNDVDGIVFVADSQPYRLEANMILFRKILQLVHGLGKPYLSIPIVVQCNKQDLSLALPPDIIKKKLKTDNDSIFNAVANQNIGVFETLKEVILRIGKKMDPFALASSLQ